MVDICPECCKRVAVLYGGRYFRCRHCHHLTYACQSEGYHDRLSRKVHKFERRLEEHLGRPKGMHRKTHERLRNRAISLNEVLDMSFCQHNAEPFRNGAIVPGK